MPVRVRPEVASVTESPLVTIATIAERMPGSLKLCYGESDMPTPDFICRAASTALDEGHTFYTHTAGYHELRSAIAEQVFALHTVRYDPSEIISTVGGSMAIYAAIRACIGPGDNAVIVHPAYAIYTNGVALSGGASRTVPLARSGAGFHLDLDRIRRAIDASTRMLIVNSPSNPTGWVISVEEQQALYELAERHNLVLLADEVYERFVFDAPIAPSFARIAPDKERLIVVNSFSKTYNMTGWRLGWAQTSERMTRLMYSAAEFMTSNASAMVQRAGIVALRDGEPYVREVREHYAARRAQVTHALESMAGVSLPTPLGAFYAFPQIAGLSDSSGFAERLVRETGVALAPGVAFGAAGEGHLRLCFAATEGTVGQALERLAEFLGNNRLIE